MKKLLLLTVSVLLLIAPVESGTKHKCRPSTIGYKYGLFSERTRGEYVICTYRLNPPQVP